ncbi:MAG TPA: STAS domain-containing protein [Jatrophihabitantaceae bacterium]|jgi:anti-sigma B factor antagonist/stage II sporulation protein AA (anti-sigma F factor antagonist)
MFPFTDPRETADRRWLAASGADTGMLDVRTVLAQGRWAYLWLCGELDIATAGSLAGIIDEQFDSGRRIIQLDLSGLRFIDCTGLGTLMHAHNECLAHRGTLILSHVGPPAARLLELTGLSEVLFITDKVTAPAP